MEAGRIDRRRRYTLSVIREAFFALLAEVGFAKMTVADICRHADINRGTFYLHYEDKFAPLDALIDEALAAAPPLEGTETGPSASAHRQTMTIICFTWMTTRTPGWRSASSSAALSRWFPRLWRRLGFRARTPICSSSTTSREISRSTACSVGDGGPSSPTRRSCSVPIPKGVCGRYRVVTIPVVHLERGPIQTGSAVKLRNERFRSYSFRKDRPQCLWNKNENSTA